MKIKSLLSPITVIAASILMLAGCGKYDNGPRQHHVFGEAFHDGKPITTGRVTFVPDEDRSNSGPPGYAIIQNGIFNTTKPGGKASVAGPIKVLVTCYGEPDANGVLPEEPLFVDYAILAEIDPDQKKKSLKLEIPLQTKKATKKLTRK